ncbi:MAG: hypothetical protein ACLR56_11260 [Oscillospiraceae bacterium]
MEKAHRKSTGRHSSCRGFRLSRSHIRRSACVDERAATQFIIWEYQQGLRTAPDEQIADRRYRAKIAGTPAETAYKTILANIRKYISDPQYSGNTQNLYGFVQLTSGSTSKEQEIICFYGETPKLLEKGYIEVYKKDTDGNLLDGAEFSVYNSSGAYVTKIGPTVNGYARSAKIRSVHTRWWKQNFLRITENMIKMSGVSH